MRRCNEADTIYHLAAAVLTGILFVSVTVFFRGYWTMAETAGDNPAFLGIASSIRHWDFHAQPIKAFWGFPYANARRFPF